MINQQRYYLRAPIFRITRLRSANGEPVILERRYVAMKLCPEIASQHYQESLHELYEKTYGLALREMDQMLSTVIVEDAEIMAMFDIGQPIPAFRMDAVTICENRKIVEIAESLYRGDRYRFSVQT